MTSTVLFADLGVFELGLWNYFAMRYLDPGDSTNPFKIVCKLPDGPIGLPCTDVLFCQGNSNWNNLSFKAVSL